MTQTEESLKILAGFIINRMAKGFKLTNEKHYRTSSYIYVECRELHYYILNDETEFIIHRTNHKLKKIRLESTIEKDNSNIRTYLKSQITEKPKNFINEFATLVKETGEFKYEIQKYKGRTTEQKALTALKRNNTLNDKRKKEQMRRERIKERNRYETFVNGWTHHYYTNSNGEFVKNDTYYRNLTYSSLMIGYLYLPYGFQWGIHGKQNYGYENPLWIEGQTFIYCQKRLLSTETEAEFNQIIDDAINLYNTDILTIPENLIHTKAVNYKYRGHNAFTAKMKALYRIEKQKPYKTTITNVLLNTRMNSNCVDAIMEYL